MATHPRGSLQLSVCKGTIYFSPHLFLPYSTPFPCLPADSRPSPLALPFLGFPFPFFPFSPISSYFITFPLLIYFRLVFDSALVTILWLRTVQSSSHARRYVFARRPRRILRVFSSDSLSLGERLAVLGSSIFTSDSLSLVVRATR